MTKSSNGKRNHVGTWYIAMALGVVLSIALTACSSTVTNRASHSSNHKQSSSVERGITRAKAIVQRYTATPSFPSVGKAFNAKKAAGKLIYLIPIDISGFNKSIVDAEQRLGRLAGAKVVLWPSSGTPSSYEEGFNAAIAAKANLIDIGGMDPATLGPEISGAKRAGIPMSLNLWGDGPSATLPSGFEGGVNMPWTLAGELEADYAIEASKGNVHALILTWSGVPQSAEVNDGVVKAFAANCPKCSYVVKSEPVTNQSAFSSVTAGAIAKDPTINWVIPNFDTDVPFAEEGASLEGAAGRIHIDGLDGTPSVLATMRPGSEVSMDIGTSADWIGYAAMTNDLRVVTGHGAITTSVPPRVFTANNVASAGQPPSFANGYGSSLITPFVKLLGV